MNEYIITRVDSADAVDFSGIPTAAVSEYPWQTGNNYRPKTTAQLIYIENSAFLLRMECRETAPKAVYTRNMDPVYKDSCMEFFFSLDGKSYVNCEMNAKGALLCCFGTSRGDRTPVYALAGDTPKVTAGKNDAGWCVLLNIPLSVLYKLYGEIDFSDEFTFYGNFYKCGDETASPHYGAWNPVTTPKPDFHRPECFGKMILPHKNT